MPLTEHQNGSITLSAGRADMCRDAAWEAEELALMLPGMVANPDPDGNEALTNLYRVRGLAARLKELALLIGICLSDPDDDEGRLYRRLYLESPPDGFGATNPNPRPGQLDAAGSGAAD